MTWWAVGLGAMVGAPGRYLLDREVSRRLRRPGWPWGTLLINVVGSALLGALIATAGPHTAFFALAGTGAIGAFTTFSTFTWEVLALADEGQHLLAAGYLMTSLVLGLAAAAATMLLL